jgi:hypothetical protein
VQDRDLDTVDAATRDVEDEPRAVPPLELDSAGEAFADRARAEVAAEDVGIWIPAVIDVRWRSRTRFHLNGNVHGDLLGCPNVVNQGPEREGEKART